MATLCADMRPLLFQTVWKLAYPLEIAVMVWQWGWVDGLLLTYIWSAVVGVYYFTMALL